MPSEVPRAPSATAGPLLRLKDVTVAYGVIEVLHQVSLEVRDGEMVTLLGANGAGKTTTLAAISGLQPIQSGIMEYAGQSLVSVPAEHMVKIGIAHVPEGRRIFSKLTVEENLRLGAFHRSREDEVQRDMENIFELFPILKDRRRQLGGTLSGGEQQMLAIGRGLMSRPKLMLLDEPSLGLAPKAEQLIFEVIKRINQEGTTILLVEQNAAMALHTAHRGYVMETGRILLEGRAEDLLHNDQVRQAYLGE